MSSDAANDCYHGICTALDDHALSRLLGDQVAYHVCLRLSLTFARICNVEMACILSQLNLLHSTEIGPFIYIYIDI